MVTPQTLGEWDPSHCTPSYIESRFLLQTASCKYPFKRFSFSQLVCPGHKWRNTLQLLQTSVFTNMLHGLLLESLGQSNIRVEQIIQVVPIQPSQSTKPHSYPCFQHLGCYINQGCCPGFAYIISPKFTLPEYISPTTRGNKNVTRFCQL